MEGEGTVVGKKALDFSLYDQEGGVFNLASVCTKGPVLLIFYPGDFTLVCTKQLCNYRDNMASFSEYGVRLVGVSKNPGSEHQDFAKKYDFAFPLLTDHKNQVARNYGCTSAMMLGMVSRAVFIINKNQMILYRYVEPTVLTRRSADELLGIIKDLRTHKLI